MKCICSRAQKNGVTFAVTPFQHVKKACFCDYLNFRLSITACSSQRLFFSFDSWPLTQW